MPSVTQPVCSRWLFRPILPNSSGSRCNVPAGAPAGVYRGSIALRSGGRLWDTVPLELEVLPFDLQPRRLESSIYFHWGIDLDTKGQRHRAACEAHAGPAQSRAGRTLLAHGVDNRRWACPFGSGLLPWS